MCSPTPEPASLVERAQAAGTVPEAATGSGRRRPEARHLFGVGVEGLLDAICHLVARGAERDDSCEVGEVRAPPSVLGTFIDDHVLTHRRCSKPLAR